MNKAVSAFKNGHRNEARAILGRAERCLNLEQQPPAIRNVLGFYAALYLKEILDRSDIPPFEEIPDAKAVEAQKLSSWTIPYTEITIAVAKDAPAGSGFLFTAETVEKSEQFFDKVKSLPYKPGAQGAFYERLSSSAGPIVSKELMDRMPRLVKRKSSDRLRGNGWDCYCTL